MTRLRHSARSASVFLDLLDDVVGATMVHIFGLPDATRLSTFWLLGHFGVGEYALVYRAGLSDETRPFKLGLWNKSYSFGHGTLQIRRSPAHRWRASFIKTVPCAIVLH